MKPIIKLKKVMDGWTVQFYIGVQGFTLDIVQPRTKEEAKWYKERLQEALNNLKRQKS